MLVFLRSVVRLLLPSSAPVSPWVARRVPAWVVAGVFWWASLLVLLGWVLWWAWGARWWASRFGRGAAFVRFGPPAPRPPFWRSLARFVLRLWD